MFRRLTTVQLGIDLAIAGVWAAIFVPVAFDTTTFAVGSGWVLPPIALAVGLLFPLLLAGSLALRRLSPGLALAAAWTAVLVQMAGTFPPGWADAAVFAVLFATAAYGGRIVYWSGLTSAIIGGLAAALYIFATLFGSVTVRYGIVFASILLAALVALMLSWTAGALARSTLRARNDRRAATVATAQAAASDERERIARDMHDVVAHSLAVVIAQADGARYASQADPDAATAALSTISATARAALADVRLLLTQLRHREGVGPQPTLADLDVLYAQVRAAGVVLDVEVDPAPPGVPPAGVQLAVYRILQEALTNALRHGGGAPVAVRLAWHPDRVDVSVRNRVPVGAVARGSGHGLIGMGERAQLAGGTVTAAERAGEFAVEATLPIAVSAHATIAAG